MEEKDIFWEEFKRYLEGVLSQSTYSNWVSNVQPIRMGNQSITIKVPNTLTKNYWERHLSTYILQYSYQKYGVEYEPTFVLVPPTESSSYQSTNQPTHSSYINSGTQINAAYSFDNFVTGEGNKMAWAAALAVVDNPGTTYNPFLIYGGVGLGKTHLMQAIGNEIKKRNPSVNIKYATSEEFTNNFISSIQNGEQQEFRDMYRKIDVLLIDDIQFFNNKGRTQEEFFHTFNALYNNNKQIVLTSDRLPNNIDNLEERLISRFKWGLSTDITPPDLETRIAILRKKASNENIDIDSKALTYIANNVDTNIRELEGALKRVLAYSTIQAREITTSLAAEALQGILDKDKKKPLTTNRIIETVARHYGITVNEIKGKKRRKEIVNPRQVAMYLARELTDLSFPKIGEEFGNKNHSTVIHAYEKIHEALTSNEEPQLTADIKKIKDQLK